MISERARRMHPEICELFTYLYNSGCVSNKYTRYCFKSPKIGLSISTMVDAITSAGYSITFVKSGDSAPQSLLDLKKG